MKHFKRESKISLTYKERMDTAMKKTRFWFCVSETVYLQGIFRRVWTDGERFFVKYNGQTWDVTDKQDWFIPD